MQAPLRAVRRWLAAMEAGGRTEAVSSIPDVEAGRDDDEPPRHDDGIAACAVWSGDAVRIESRGRALRPGATVVVPAEYGGISAGTWDPTAEDPVVHLGTQALWRQRQAAVLRLAIPLPGIGTGDRTDDDGPAPPEPAETPELDDPETDRAAVVLWLAEAQRWLADHGDHADGHGDGHRAGIHEVITAVLAAPRPDVRVVSLGNGRRAFVVRALPRRGQRADSEGSTSAFLGEPVTLDRHLADVGALAARFAEVCGLPPTLAADVELAGRLHDVGKADPRFPGDAAGGPGR
jgi:CRISPR-associated endonuclease/helicase Cas3